MVGVRVCDGDGVETMNATRPEIRRDDLFADVEVGMHPEGKASGVDEERVAIGRDDEGESPCPTSMAVTSRMLGCKFGTSEEWR